MKSSFDELVKIMEILREKCPWDRLQTHESLKRYLIEETYEVLEAIDEKDYSKLKEELGDVLLQVVFHAKIAQENDSFDIYDVISNICEKMKKRHTHVFGNDIAKTSDEVLNNWDRIKNEEKNLKNISESMESIPNHLPALMRSQKIQEKASRVGFDWDNIDDALKKVYEELSEFEEIMSKDEQKDRIKEEIGDILFAVVNIARFCNVDAEDALRLTNKKFIRRFSYIEQNASNIGMKVDEMSLKEMDKFWEEAKKI